MLNIATYLPENILSNKDLEYLGWESKKIYKKTGIKQRHVSSEDETALDLAFNASLNILNKYDINRGDIDYILYCTQSPDYTIPNNVSVLHKRLNLRRNIGALEYNQGCSGYVYGLSIAKSLISAKIAKNVLFVTADTYSKYINSEDRTNKTIFGDGATATFLDEGAILKFGEFIFGTDGSGAHNLCLNNSGLSKTKLANCEFNNSLYMNGPEIFNFTIENVPTLINDVLNKNNKSMDDIDHFLFHQANEFMLDYLRDKMGIPPEKFHKYIKNTGNTVSSSIPLLIEDLNSKNVLNSGDNLLIIGFGVGYSWSAVIIEY